MPRPKHVLLALGFAAAHQVAVWSAVLLSLEGLDIDAVSQEPSFQQRAGEVGVEVLGFPALQFWEGLGLGASAPDALEWAFFVGNSLLWGCVLAALLVALKRWTYPGPSGAE